MSNAEACELKFYPFKMERWQSAWENKVDYNLSESGVHPLTLQELLNGESFRPGDQSLGYIQTNGTEGLRQAIASLYEGAKPSNVLVTNGSSEANLVSTLFFLENGGQIVMMLPNYMQIWGLGKTFQSSVRPVWLRKREGRWGFDLKQLKKTVTRRTILIAVCNPNNPTGSVLSEEEMDEIVGVARRAGSWILSDEVYSGAELGFKATPSFWGRYDRVLITNGLSKAYGLPGLRIGWVASSEKTIDQLWSYHDYTSIGPAALSDRLATLALQPDNRRRLLTRAKEILRRNLGILKAWAQGFGGKLSFIPPQAGAIALIKYSLPLRSDQLARRLLTEKSTLIVPGSHFNMGKYMRIGYGGPKDYLEAGLTRISEFVNGLSEAP